MFACFGLRARHKRLSTSKSDIELTLPLNGIPIARSLTLTRTPPIHRPPTPHGTPIPRRASLRKKKRLSEYSDSADECKFLIILYCNNFMVVTSTVHYFT